jgi:hypothetical protein
MTTTAAVPAAERALTKNQVIAELTRSPHKDLAEFTPVATRAAVEDPDFYAHLVAWNEQKGSVRDAKVALPVLAMGADPTVALLAHPNAAAYAQNALAHVAKQGPRELLRAIRFAHDSGMVGRRQRLRRLVRRWLRDAEASPSGWERLALTHRGSLRKLYAWAHVRPAEFAWPVMRRETEPGTVFDRVAQLRTVDAHVAADYIMRDKIPLLVAKGALGARAKEPAFVRALVARMTPAEVATNLTWLERACGDDAALKAEVAAAMRRKQHGGARAPQAALKAGHKAKEVQDETLRAAANDMQEKALTALGGVDGDWLVVADKSGSMTDAISMARRVAGTLAKSVRGTVNLVFVDRTPRRFDVTGKTLAEIEQLTVGIMAGGGTDLGAALAYARLNKLPCDGVALVSDGEDGVGSFAAEFKRLSVALDKEPTLYYYDCPGGHSNIEHQCRTEKVSVEVVPLRGKSVDDYALPNLVQTMRTNQFSLLDEVLATPLLTLDGVLARTTQMGVL